MNKKNREISQEMYHRIYRLSKKNASVHSIAATLRLPVRTVMGVLNRLERMDAKTDSDNSSQDSTLDTQDSQYLDIYVYPKTRFAVVDLVGTLSESHSTHLQNELEKVVVSSWKAVAIRMHDVTELSETAGTILLTIKNSFDALGKYFALLDPASAIESDLIKFELEEKIPIFGTERAFEEKAFLKKGNMFTRRGNQEGT